MTFAFSLLIVLPASVDDMMSLNQLMETVMPVTSESSSPSATAQATRVPIVCGETFRLSPSLIDDDDNTSLLAAVFCPSTLLESSYEQLQVQVDGSHPIAWLENPSRISHVLLSLIHPFLAKNFTIRAIVTTKGMQHHAPGDLMLLDLSHCPRAAIVDLMDSTNCQVIHSGPEAILKVLLVSGVEFTATAKHEEAMEASHQMTPTTGINASSTVDIPTCAVCLHRIDPLRLGLSRPQNYHLCSKFCPPPNLANRCGDAVSCPRQRLLRPWPPPSHCEACQVIRNYWRKDEDDRVADDTEDHLVCSYCGMKETLWVCLTCASVGCGRYSNKHAAEHNSATRHPFCLELSTLRIWSYVDGEFAHRPDLLECPSSPPLLQPWVVRGRPSASFASVVSAASSSENNARNPIASKYAASNPNDQHNHEDYERMIALNFASVDEKTPKKATMIGEEYEALLHSALEEQAQHYDGEITWLRATLTAQQVDQESMTPDDAAEIEDLREQIAALRADIDRAGRQLLDSQAQEAGHRATSQQLLREQRVAQDLLKKIREELASEHEQGQMQIEELELQIDDLTANQRMMQQFSQNEDLKNSQIFGTEQSSQPKTKKGKKLRKFLRR